MKALAAAAAFLTICPGPRSRDAGALSELGRNVWWTFPLVEATAAGLTIAVALALARLLPSPGVIAAVCIGLDHALHGFRRLDGFSDLTEGIFYKLSNASADRELLWKIVRAPQNGPYGTALIALLLLLHWSLVSHLLSLGQSWFITGVTLATVGSKLALAVAVAAPARFRPNSDFGSLAAGVGRPLRLVLMALMSAGIALAVIAVTGQATMPRCWVMVLTALPASLGSGLLARIVVLGCLGELNGDVMGFAWCLAEIVLLLLASVIGSLAP